MKSKRIFIGIKVSRNVIDEIIRWSKKHKNFGVRWIKLENLHITIIPPWYEEEERVGVRVRELEKVTENFETFILRFSKISFGPDEKQPRLIWVEGNTPFEFLMMKDAIEKVLIKKPEKREFKMHLTLARFNVKDFRKFPVKKLNDEVEWKNEVKSFFLFESKLGTKGAEYKVLKEYKLG